MENHCVTVYFSLRESKKNKKGLSPIEASLSYNGERIYFSTGKFAKPSTWNKQMQKVKGNNQEASLINDFLIELRNKVYTKELELMKRGYMITVHLLKDAVLDKLPCFKEITLLQMISEYNNEKEKHIGKDIAKSTFYCFKHSESLLQEFIRKVYKRDDVTLKEVNINFIHSFHSYLLKDMSQNTTTKHLKFLKAIINRAVSNNYIDYNLLTNYRIERKPVEIDFLNEEELRRIINFDTSISRLEKARDFFLFGCFTGLAYIDI